MTENNQLKSTTANELTQKPRKWLNFLGEQGFIVIFVLWIIFLAASSKAFLTPSNLFTILRQATIIGILAIAEHYIVLLGTMDVSVASTLSLSGVLMGAMLIDYQVPLYLAIPIVLLASALIGLINGLIITRLKINPIITTLGMMSILEGLSFTYTRGKTIYGPAIDSIKVLNSGTLLGIPVPVLIMFALYVLNFLILRYTKFGAYVFATGNNEKASWLAGINTNRIKLIAFMIAGLLAGCAGIMQVARQGSATGGMGADFLFPVLTAVVLGGASLSGGRGKIVNTLIAAVFLTTITNGMILLGVDIYVQRIIQGTILIVALSLDQLRMKKG